MQQVIATAIGFDGTKLRVPDDTFSLPDDVLPGSWFEPAEEKKKEAYFKRRDALAADKAQKQAQSRREGGGGMVDAAGLNELIAALAEQNKSLLAAMQDKGSTKKGGRGNDDLVG